MTGSYHYYMMPKSKISKNNKTNHKDYILTKREPNWQNFDMIPTYLFLVKGQSEEAMDMLPTLKKVKDKPHVLCDNDVQRILKLYTEQLDTNWIFIEQCKKWRGQSPNDDQLKLIREIEDHAYNYEPIAKQILALAKFIENNTIDKILEKDDGELALEVLTGKRKLPS